MSCDNVCYNVCGHGLYTQFTRLFLFLQKWVWLARLCPNKVWRPQCLQGSIFCWDWSILASFSGLQFLILYCKRSKTGSREGLGTRLVNPKFPLTGLPSVCLMLCDITAHDNILQAVSLSIHILIQFWR